MFQMDSFHCFFWRTIFVVAVLFGLVLFIYDGESDDYVSTQLFNSVKLILIFCCGDFLYFYFLL